MSQPAIAVVAEGVDCWPRAEVLARRLGLPIDLDDATGRDFLLLVTTAGLELRQAGCGREGALRIDFVSGRSAHRRRFGGGRGQPLARAVGLKRGLRPRVLDATAGLGRDAFVLASLGCELVMLERSPVIAALLQDAIERAVRDPAVRPVAARMQLRPGDAADCLATLTDAELPDVVYLDPMYPHRTKSALVKKEMRLFRRLVGDDSDALTLLSAARQHARFRVVVKRPASSEWLAGQQPSMQIRSPNTRYDVYIKGRM